MNTVVVNSSIRFVGILLFQVLVLNNIELHGFINPYIYPLAILLLPFNTPKWLLLVLGFCAGLFVDVFANTPGLHAAATVLLAYLRPLIVLVNRPPSDYESSDQPTVNSLGFNWFIIYATIAVLIHHI